MAPIWFPWAVLRAPDAIRENALAGPTLDTAQRLDDVATAALGGAETPEGAVPIRTPLFEGAVFSCRGRGYARYNEDAAFVVQGRAGDVYAAVLDQAGGLGGDRRGEASALAAETIFEALKARYGAALHDRADDAMNDWTSGLANNRMPNDRAATDRAATDRAAIERDREKASASDVACLTGAYAKAHDRLVSRRQGEVTTAISLRAHSLARGGSAALLAVLVNSGDSGAFLLDSAGKVKERTQLQEWTRSPQVGALTHAIGLVPEGPAPESYVWEVEEGDWLLLCSDGLLDAGLGAAGVAKILKLSTSAEEAANRLCLRILRRMVFLLAKPDNLSVVLLRALAQRG